MQDLFRHEALPFNGPERFVPSCASVVRDGFENDERVVVLGRTMSIGGVRDELGPDAEDVTFVAMDEHGRNPNRVTTMLHSFQSVGDGRNCVAVNELSFAGRSPASRHELVFADAILNFPSLRTWPLSLVCLYDLDDVGPDGATRLRQSHAVLRGQDINVEYEPDLASELYGRVVDAPPPSAHRSIVAGRDLAAMRDFVRRAAAPFPVTPDRVDDLVLAANEIVTNSIRHGGGRAAMTLWSADGSLICEVRDHGYISDLLAGRFAPTPSSTSGRGLWLANHLCDLVQVRSSTAGTVVRMYIDESAR